LSLPPDESRNTITEHTNMHSVVNFHKARKLARSGHDPYGPKPKCEWCRANVEEREDLCARCATYTALGTAVAAFQRATRR